MRKQTLLFIPIIYAGLMEHSIASNYSIHISEKRITETHDNTNNVPTTSFLHLTNEQDSHNEKSSTFITSNSKKKLETNMSSQEAKALGSSIELEVYKFSENKTSHTVFESGLGICRGFKSQDGVDVTDSRTYYLDKQENEYYASIASATIYENTPPKYTQYAPLFNIKDPSKAKTIQDDENKYGKDVAKKNLQKTSVILPEIICK